MSGLIAPGGLPGQVLEAVRRGRIDAVASWALAEEIVEVLRRPALRRYGVTEGDIEELLLVLGPLLPDVDVAVAVQDADDAVVIAAAIAGRAEVIVSGDRDLLADVAPLAWLDQRGIAVLAPADALAASHARETATTRRPPPSGWILVT